MTKSELLWKIARKWARKEPGKPVLVVSKAGAFELTFKPVSVELLPVRRK
jgi:hypothetical protein